MRGFCINKALSKVLTEELDSRFPMRLWESVLKRQKISASIVCMETTIKHYVTALY